MRKAKSNAMLRGLAASALVLMVSATAWGQKVKITGTVIDNTNEPVIGASVLEVPKMVLLLTWMVTSPSKYSQEPDSKFLISVIRIRK